MNTYARQPVASCAAKRVALDEAGKKYLDALAGIAVNTLAMRTQADARAHRADRQVMHTQTVRIRSRRRRRPPGRITAGRGVLLQFGLEATSGDQIARKYGTSAASRSRDLVMEKRFTPLPRHPLATGSRKVQPVRAAGLGFWRVPLNDSTRAHARRAQPQRPA